MCRLGQAEKGNLREAYSRHRGPSNLDHGPFLAPEWDKPERQRKKVLTRKGLLEQRKQIN